MRISDWSSDVCSSDLLAAARLAVLARAALVQQRADGFDHFDVLLLGVAADVVGLADTAAFEHRADRAAVVAHIHPVADVPAVAVDRQRLAGKGPGDDQRA